MLSHMGYLQVALPGTVSLPCRHDLCHLLYFLDDEAAQWTGPSRQQRPLSTFINHTWFVLPASGQWIILQSGSLVLCPCFALLPLLWLIRAWLIPPSFHHQHLERCFGFVAFKSQFLSFSPCHFASLSLPAGTCSGLAFYYLHFYIQKSPPFSFNCHYSKLSKNTDCGWFFSPPPPTATPCRKYR